jgi:hypothetical protein
MTKWNDLRESGQEGKKSNVYLVYKTYYDNKTVKKKFKQNLYVLCIQYVLWLLNCEEKKSKQI